MHMKKLMSLKVPKQNKTNCIRRNLCSAICRPSAISPYLPSDDEVSNLPSKLKEGFESTAARGPAAKGVHHKIHTSPYDCIVCELCIHYCQTHSLSMLEIASDNGTEAAKSMKDLFIYINDCIEISGRQLYVDKASKSYKVVFDLAQKLPPIGIALLEVILNFMNFLSNYGKTSKEQKKARQ